MATDTRVSPLALVPKGEERPDATLRGPVTAPGTISPDVRVSGDREGSITAETSIGDIEVALGKNTNYPDSFHLFINKCDAIVVTGPQVAELSRRLSSILTTLTLEVEGWEKRHSCPHCGHYRHSE